MPGAPAKRGEGTELDVVTEATGLLRGGRAPLSSGAPKKGLAGHAPDRGRRDSESKLRALRGCFEIDALMHHFGRKLVSVIFILNFSVNCGFWLHSQAQPYILKEYNVPAPTAAVLQTVSNLPQTLAPIIGLLCDLFPMGGYKKAPCIILAQVLGIGALFTLGSDRHSHLHISGVVACLFLMCLQITTIQVLVDARKAAALAVDPQHGPSLVSFGAAVSQVGELVTNMVAGPLIKMGARLPCLLATVPYSTMLFPVGLGYLEETPVSRGEAAAARAKIFATQPTLCLLTLLLFICAVCAALCSAMSQAPLTNACVHAALVLIVLCATSVVLSPIIARCCALLMFYHAVGMYPSQADFYFWTDTAEQFPGGPNFSEVFFNTVMRSIGVFPSLFGIYLYNRYLSTWKYRHLLVLSSTMLACVCSWQSMAFAGVNIRLGIPYNVWILGTVLSINSVDMWFGLSLSMLLALICPKGQEATLLALLLGCKNLGGVLSGSLTGLILDYFDVKPSGAANEAMQFRNLWKVTACMTAISLLRIPMAYVLLPGWRQGDSVDTFEDATSGSLSQQ